MKNPRPILGLLLATLLAAVPAQAEVKDIASNLDSKIRVKIVAYPNSPGASVVPDFMIEDATITTEFMYQWATWFETPGNVRVDTTGWFEYGLPYSYRWTGGFRLFQDDDMQSRPLVVNELYATKPVGNLDMVVGRAIERNTVSVLYPLADRYVARDLNDPIDPKILGVWQARADYYLQDWQFSVAALPVFQPPKIPGIESRWWIQRIEPITGEPIPPGATGRLERDVPNVSLENTGALATIITHQQQWDAFSTVYHGYTPYSVTRVDSPSPNDYVVTLEYVPGFEWSGGVSTVIDTIELHTEALYHHSYSGKDDDYINGLAGLTWRTDRLAEWLHCNQAHLIVEYAREHVISEQKASSGFVSSSEPFRLGRNSLFTECLLEITARDMASVAYVHNFAESNAFAQLRGGHRFGNGMRLDLVVDLFAGSGLYFGTWDNNDRIYLDYEFNF